MTEIECPWCGLKVYLNHRQNEVMHAEPVCSQFLEAIDETSGVEIGLCTFGVHCTPQGCFGDA